ncbi:hypothetical protein PGQ11_014168 [Apiospora arundinis]|uniref:MUC1 Extracellular alpha-1,4-glucan glucosidase n=1 Tax=Apiospora arundinis TaxID=335852 RepID=A0ABR2HS19_9PEZI
MFGSRKSRRGRGPPNPHSTPATVNPNASTAAAAAFMSSQNSNRSLSSAAAAAALRARPHTPTNVGAVQTKRTMRRSPSISSVSSAPAGGRGTPKLERRGSSGSMSERTFRSPSPHGREPQGQNQYPPVPAIPDGHRNSTIGRSPSTVGVGMQNFRTASQKMKTELPSWYTKPSGDTSNVRTSDAPMTNTGKTSKRPESLIAAGRPDSQNSVNFSYPSRHRATSPSPSPTADRNPQWGLSPSHSNRASLPASFGGNSDQAMVYDPNSRRMVPRTDRLDLMEVEYHTREASEKQPKKKKGVQRSGSHLAKGTVARVKGTTVEPNEQERNSSNRSSPIMATPPNGRDVSTDGRSHVEVNSTGATANHSGWTEPSQDQQSQSEEQNRCAGESTAQVAEAPSGRLVGRKPSVVRELPEEDATELEEPVNPTSKSVRQALDSVPTQQTLYPTPEDPGESSSSARNEPPTRVDSPEEAPAEQKVAYMSNKPVAELSRNGSTSRSASNSPARTARFATIPSENLAVRHAPLPRSASPIKSALKHPDSAIRDASPSENSSDLRVTSPERETSVARKKSVRVSFDDHNTKIVGESAPAEDEDSPVAPSPQQTKRPWYSNIGRNKKKDFSLDDDEIMKPRPALPSFGSVREKKLREPEEERPLIRPSGSAHSPATPSSSSMRPSNAGITAPAVTPDSPSVSQSNDHAVGFIISQDQSSRNAANISRFREPLPPVVTTAEAHRYDSDSASSYSEDGLSNDEMSGGSDVDVIPSTQTTMPDSYDHMDSPPTIPDKSASRPKGSHAEPDRAIELPDNQVPAISITNPSPAILDDSHPSESKSNLQQYFEVPGTFPNEEAGEVRPSKHTTNTTASSDNVSRSARAIVEPKTEVQPAQIAGLPQATLSGVPTAADVTDSADDESNASIYSDAYEDLSDIEGDGYQSLNAVVESPLSSKEPTAAPVERPSLTKPDSSEAMGNHMLEKVIKDAEGSTEPTPHVVNDWETAKSYWRSLTTEKRRQLEREAMIEAGDDADAETPTRRPSNRKKTPEQIKSTSMAQMAQSQAPAHGSKPSQPNNPERTYMIQPGTKATQEFHDAPPPSTRMRTSLRTEQPVKHSQSSRPVSGEVHMRKSMRGTTAAEETADSRASRRVSAPPERPSSMSKTSLRPQTAAPGRKPTNSTLASASAGNAISKTAKPILQRRGSDASDSSFKRSRATSSGGFGFRSTMRQAPVNEASAPAERSSGRFSIRSISPPGSPFRRGSSNTAGGPPVALGMRRTLRSNSESSQDSKRSSIQFPSFGRSRKESKKSKQPSRLRDDSSDDDSPVAPAFRSRFADSSDEDEAVPQPPTRPITMGTLRGSATTPSRFQRSSTVVEEAEEAPGLQDSGDDRSMQMPSPLRSPKSAALFRPMPQRQSSSGIGTSTLNRSGSGRGRLNEPAYTSPESPKNRRSFMDNILRRNKKADQAGKIQRAGVTESAARRDTLLERDAGELRGLRGDTVTESPKLQKRRPDSRNDDSWPLPNIGEDGRPSTADGRVNGGPVPRPNFAGRRSTSLGLPGALGQSTDYDNKDGLEPDNHSKKKKKFGALRRMFRLDD